MREWMHIKAVVVIGLILLSASAVRAHGGGSWWDTPEVVEALKLNEGEINQLNEAYDAYSLRMIEIKSRVETEQFKLQTVLEKADLDESAINAQYNRLEEARALLSKERFGFFVEARKIIGPHRFHQLMEIYKERKAKRKRSESDSKQ
jgi:Spy/CpxP family protein refolding chaperone